MAFEHERQILLFRSSRPLRHFFVSLFGHNWRSHVGLVTISLKRTLFVVIIRATRTVFHRSCFDLLIDGS